jgi:hypothetical protein
MYNSVQKAITEHVVTIAQSPKTILRRKNLQLNQNPDRVNFLRRPAVVTLQEPTLEGCKNYILLQIFILPLPTSQLLQSCVISALMRSLLIIPGNTCSTDVKISLLQSEIVRKRALYRGELLGPHCRPIYKTVNANVIKMAMTTPIRFRSVPALRRE